MNFIQFQNQHPQSIVDTPILTRETYQASLVMKMPDKSTRSLIEYLKPLQKLFKINSSLHHLLVHSKPSLLIYNMSQSVLKWGRCVHFTKTTYFPDLLRVKWSYILMYKSSWIQTTWVRKYIWQAFQRFKPCTKRSSVAPGMALRSLDCCAVPQSRRLDYPNPGARTQSRRLASPIPGAWNHF